MNKKKNDPSKSDVKEPVRKISELPPTLPSVPIKNPNSDLPVEKKSSKISPHNKNESNPAQSTPNAKEFDDQPVIRGQMPDFGTFRNERIALNQTPARGVTPAAATGSFAPQDEKSLSPVLQSQIQETVSTLFRINVGKSGAGDSPIVEMPVSLRQAIGNTQGIQERLAIVEAYWDLRTLIAKLEIEKSVLKISESTLNDLPAKLRAFQGTPDLNALTGSWRAEILRSQAKIDEIKISVREGQIQLLRKMGRSTENGWPIPSSVPFWGPAYRLETAGARTSSFLLLTELILIPEKLQTIRETGPRLGSANRLFIPEFSTWSKTEDGWRFLKLLDNKRKNAIFFIDLLKSLNCSIARYVSYYSAIPVPNEIFVKSLIGSAN